MEGHRRGAEDLGRADELGCRRSDLLGGRDGASFRRRIVGKRVSESWRQARPTCDSRYRCMCSANT
jgi:hypothetical protein